jgi:glyoxylase-like metal-dependent hydrolase (beta-lactamase superfamily II)
MPPHAETPQRKMTRRSFVANAAVAGGAALIAGGANRAFAAQAAAPQSSMLTQAREAAAKTPIQTTKLTDTVFLLQGVGGNQVAQTGPDGKLLIDSSFSTAAPHVSEALAKLDAHPLRLLVNTHWHFDHTDGNAAMHDAGAFIIAHRNTRQRMATPQDIAAYKMHFDPSPASALPQQTFDETQALYFNGDELALVHLPPAHTDTDIYIYFKGANVLHTGDLWFNGFYPFIDASSGGKVRGMISGCDQLLAVADDRTKIVPGHGPLGDKKALADYRAMLATVADSVEKLKSSGRTLEEIVAAKPTAPLDAAWGKGLMSPDAFTAVVYSTL